MSMVPNYSQWHVPLEGGQAKLNYSQLPLPNEQTESSFSTFSERSHQPSYNTNQSPPVPIPRHDYPVIHSHPQPPPNFYSPNSSSSLAAWSTSNERDSSKGQYWQHRR